jgi:hypothetical protein
MTGPKYHVGQVLIRRDANEDRLGGPQKATVVKVGRKLVTVSAGQYDRTETFRIEDGIKNDNFGHGWIQTEEEFEEEKRRGAVEQRFRDHGLSWYGTTQRWSVETLTRVADILDAERLS